MSKSLEEWKNKTYNTPIDVDNKSNDCVDVSKSWIMYLTDKPWTECAGWGDAKNIYYYWYDTYLERIPRGNQPKEGDIVCMDGTVGSGYGHTGVVVRVDGPNITIYQQNTFTQQPVYTGVYNAYSSYIIGFLRPKVAFTLAQAKLEGYQRITSYEVAYHDAPRVSATVLRKLSANDIYDFKGYVHGESVDGNDIWFVGRYTGGYVWSGAFTDSGVHDLENLTTVNLQPYQRQVGSSVVNYRKLPEVTPDNVITTFKPAEIIDFDAWTHGAYVDGSDIWFRGRYTGGWSHSGGYTNQTTTGLKEVKLEVVAKPVEPVFPKPTTDQEVTKVYNKKNPISSGYSPDDLVDVGGGQKLRKEAADSLALMQQQTHTLTLASGYRSYATQQSLYNQYVKDLGQAEADRQSARPGYSEHQTGLTMDFAPIDETFDTTTASAWLKDNAYKYGWVLRYPSNKESITGYMYEPWHWRYVGVNVAADMRAKGVITLEEYYNIQGGGYPTQDDDPTKNPLWSIFESIVKFLVSIVNKLKK